MSERLEYIPDFTKTGKELLVDLLNYANTNSLMKPLEAEKIWFTKPVKLVNDKSCNTRISISDAVGYRGFEYPTDIEYNRLDIYQLAMEKGFSQKVYIDKPEEVKTTRDLLPYLWEVFKVKLIDEDIINQSLNLSEHFADQSKEGEENIRLFFPLQISDDSIAYYGSLTLCLVPKPIRLDTVIRKTRLPYSFVQIQRGGLS